MDIVKKYFKYSLCLVLFLSSIFIFNTLTSVKAASDIVLTFSDGSIEETVSGSGYNINGTTLEITKAGTYIIKGHCSEGNIEVKKEVTGVKLVLDNLTLRSAKTAPIVVKKDGASATIKLVGTNVLIDDEDPEAELSPDPAISGAFEGSAIKVKSGSTLTIEGPGTLAVQGVAKNGIKGGSGAGIVINGGNIIINAANTGLACDGTIDMNGGNLQITAYNEGIKLEPDPGDTTSLARINITGGRTTINSGEDGIQAIGDVNIYGWAMIIINSGSDGIQTRSNFYINHSSLTIHTFEGYDTDNFDKDALSAKGIKASPTDDVAAEGATNTITIIDGLINIDASDDGIHSDGSILIDKGTITVKSGDDGIHADTKLTIGSQGGLERDPEIYVENSIEGIEAGNIYMYSGKVSVNAIDDGMNAAGGASSGSSKDHGEHFNPDTGQMEDNYALYIYGGDIFVNCEGDGLDANGSIYLYGGTQIIYHQDAQGNNSALDRDSKLVIDGATVFAAGGVNDNGHITTTGSQQNIYVDSTDYPANSFVLVKDNGIPVFNDQIPKRSVYTFYSSPTLGNNGQIEITGSLDEDYINPWRHTWDDGVITTPATPDTPGIKTYTCDHHSKTERKTYYYRGEVEYSIINKTGGRASVRVGDTESTSDFTTTNVDESILLTTNKDVELIQTLDGVNFDLLFPRSVSGNVYTYSVNPFESRTIYVVIDGDIDMNGVADLDDSTLLARHLMSPSNERYYPFSILQEIIADYNDNGLVNSHDGLSIIDQNLTEDTVYSADDFVFEGDDSVLLDGTADGTVTLEFKANKNINIDAIDGYFLPNIDNPSSNGYLEVVSIEKVVESEYGLSDVTNGFSGVVDELGLPLNKGDVITRVTYKVDKDTPTGTYPVSLRVNSVTAHDSYKESTFVLTSNIIVKGTTDPITAFFTKDEGVKRVDVYYTQNYNAPSETNVSSMSVRNPDTGDIIGNAGEGQVNFTVELKDGYIISDISATPSAHFKQIKGPADTDKANTYRVTKVTGDIDIVITTKQANEYTATFEKDSHVSSIDLFYTKNYDSADELDVDTGFARNGDTGAIDISGDGQINFRVNTAPGYKVKSVKVTGNYKNLKEQENRIYRITKISGDLLISVKTEKRTEVTPTVSGYDSSYTYTGSKIKPEVVVTIPGDSEDITLVKDVDYELVYGSNKNVGTDAGTITVKSIDSSNYIFDDIVVNFDITPYELTASNITAPVSMVYTGSALIPEVTVSANNITLVEGTDYNLSFLNQDGAINEDITVIVEGIGNFTGLVNTVKVHIAAKADQVVTFPEDELTKYYGDSYTMTATVVTGDGTLSYVSNNPAVASVDPNTGAVTIYGNGTVTIRAYASETATYNQGVASYHLIVKKKDITISSVQVEDKVYDGNTNATVTGVTFDGLVNSDVLVLGTDYTVTSAFVDETVGNGKTVNVTVDLSTEVIKKYSMTNNTFEATANILPITIDPAGVTISQDSYTYDGTAKEPTVSVVVGGNTLTKNVDYTVSYIDNVDAGESYAVIVGIGTYATETPIVKVFNITPRAATVTIENIDDVTYDGTAKEPTVVVKDDNTDLVRDKDYTVEYSNNIDAGTANVKINKVDTGNYNFDDTDTSTTFTINPYTLTEDNITLSEDFVKYDGTAKEPTPTVVVNGVELTKDVDYSVTYYNNINIGTSAEVIVTGISNNYTGNPSVYFEISDKDELLISGIDNQQVTYTGDPVELEGTLTVSENNDGITPSDLTVTYYDETDNEIERPTNAGKYYVVYSYLGDNYKGETRVDFEITKAESGDPDEMTTGLTGIAGDNLGNVSLTTLGLSWKDGTATIAQGDNSYTAVYVENNDSDNYLPKEVNIPVYGKAIVSIITSVDGAGGTITPTVNDVEEGTEVEITFSPYEGYEIDLVLVNNTEVVPENNKFTVTARATDATVKVKYKTREYSMNISGQDVDLDEYGIINVQPNSDKTITIESKPGYRLSSVLVNNTEKIADVTDNKITISNVTGDTKVSVKAERITYEVVEGARQEYIINKHTFARFKINAEYSLFTGGKVYVDDNEVDLSNYTSEEGSTVITFTREYMDSLALGPHTLRVTFNDGGEASTVFRVALLKYEEKEQDEDIDNPTTGDKIITYISICGISIIGIIAVIVFLLSRKNHKKSVKKVEKVEEPKKEEENLLVDSIKNMSIDDEVVPVKAETVVEKPVPVKKTTTTKKRTTTKKPSTTKKTSSTTKKTTTTAKKPATKKTTATKKSTTSTKKASTTKKKTTTKKPVAKKTTNSKKKTS